MHLRRNSFRIGVGGWLNLPVFSRHRTRYQLYTHDLAGQNARSHGL